MDMRRVAELLFKSLSKVEIGQSVTTGLDSKEGGTPTISLSNLMPSTSESSSSHSLTMPTTARDSSDRSKSADAGLSFKAGP